MFKLKYLNVILYVILIIDVQNSFGQISTDMIKYWYYRNRLNNYFVVPGGKQGESQIICVRNVIRSDNDLNSDHSKGVDYGQHGKYTGLYLGVLATEYYLLNKNGQYEDRDKTGDELYKALNAIRVWWDEAAEYYWPGEDLDPGPDGNFNGFFIRGNVPCDFLSNVVPIRPNGLTFNGLRHVDLLNMGLKTTDVWNENEHRFGNLQNGGFLPRGHPGYIDHRTCDKCQGQSETSYVPLHNAHGHDFHPESMSKDEAIMIMMGCSLADRLVGGNIGQLAYVIKKKMAECLVNTRHFWGSTPYQIYEPGHIVPEGGNSLVYAKPLNIMIGKPPTYYDNCSWAIMSWAGWDGGDMTAALAAMTDSWACVGSGIYNVTHRHDWQSFYTLLWEALQNKTRPEDKQNEILELALNQLDNAPCEGPYCYKAADEDGNGGIYDGIGWASSYKWYEKKNTQNHGVERWIGNYNGTDYMLLYNLYHIINYTTSPYYVNYVDRNISGNIPMSSHSEDTDHGAPIDYEYTGTDETPLKFVAFNKISSIQHINAGTVISNITHPGTEWEQIYTTYVAGNVTYKAGEEIVLKPGFHVEAGANFHAYIGDIDCSEGSNSSKALSEDDYPYNMYTPYFDSIVSLPKTPYPLTLEDTTGDNHLFTLECPVDTLKFMGMNGDTTEFDYYYYWDFGNGDTSTKKNPKVFYQPGNYNFTLILTDTNGVSDTARMVIEVQDCINTIHGTLNENITCGENPVAGDTLVLVDSNNLIVNSVTPAVTSVKGSFYFKSTQLATLDTNSLFNIATKSGFDMDTLQPMTIQKWINNSPLSLYVNNNHAEWVAKYVGPDSINDDATALGLAENIYVVGTSVDSLYGNRFAVINYDSTGKENWVARFDNVIPEFSIVKMSAIKLDGSANIYIAGIYREDIDTDSTYGLVIGKINSSGKLKWGLANKSFFWTNMTPSIVGLLMDKDHNIIVGCNNYPNQGFIIAKYSPNGALIWSVDNNTFGYTELSMNSMQADREDNIILSGKISTDWEENGNYLTLKLAPDGTFITAFIYPFTNNGIGADGNWIATSNIVDRDGYIYVTGYEVDDPKIIATVKYNPSTGDTIWVKRQYADSMGYDNIAVNYLIRLLPDKNGHIYVYGNAIEGESSTGYVIKYDTSGKRIWSVPHLKYMENPDAILNSAVLDKEGNIYLTGLTGWTENDTSYTNYYTVKLDTNGVEQWSATYKGSKNHDIGACIKISINGNIYVTGSSMYGEEGKLEFATVKYAQCPSKANLRSLSHPSDKNSPPPTKTPNLKVYPNPTRDEFYVEYNGDVNGQVIVTELYNIYGGLIKEVHENNKNKFTVSTRDVPSGIYFYSVRLGNDVIGKDKIVIIK